MSASTNGTPNGTPTRRIIREQEPPPVPAPASVPTPAPAPVPVPVPALSQPVAADSLPPELAMAEEQPVVRLRNGTSVINGQHVSNGHAAIQRGLEVLAEQELDQNLEEIKKLDTQLDHFNKYLDSFEKRNSELTERLNNMLKSQREERIKRRSSFMQREEEYKAQQNSFDSQINNILSKCAQSRRTSVPVFGAGIEQSIDQHRRPYVNGTSGDSSSSKYEKMDTQ